MEARVVDATHVLLAVRGGEVVVGLSRLPAVDDEIPPGRLDVPEQLGADVARALPEELGPVALGPVRALELLRVADLVAEDESDHAPIRTTGALTSAR